MTSLPAALRKTLFGKLAPVTYFVAIIYIALPGFSLNFILIWSTLFDTSPLLYKITLFFQILFGALTLLEAIELILLLTTSLLLGMNIALLLDSLNRLRHEKKLSLSVGGSTIVALVGTGCASCGVSLLSLLGISSIFLPLHGGELYVLSSGLLLLSFIVAANVNAKACRIS